MSTHDDAPRATSPEATPGLATPQLDPTLMAVLAHRFEAIVREMTNTLFRTGRSSILNMARDFSCAIVTANCELLAAAESLPIHVLSGPDLMAASMKQFHPEMKRGDAFLHNSPYHGCSHPADHTLLVPVIDAPRLLVPFRVARLSQVLYLATL